MKPNNLLVLVVSIFHACSSLREYEYDYLGSDDPDLTESNKFVYEDDFSALGEQNVSSEPSKYDSDDALPYENPEQLDSITIEQFVNELKRRKKAKEQKQENHVNSSLNKPPVDNPNKKGKKDKTRSSKPSKSKSVEQKQKRKPSKKRRNQKPREASNQKTKRPTSSKNEKKHEHTPSIKNKVKTKPSRKQKPFHKPKKYDDEEDFFQIGNSDSHQHSDHHIHQHDHLEAHKHHHKHKASHSHGGLKGVSSNL